MITQSHRQYEVATEGNLPVWTRLIKECCDMKCFCLVMGEFPT